jgi:hypothetical protein
MHDGAVQQTHLDAVYGNPKKPMTLTAQLAKFRSNASRAFRPLGKTQTEELIDKLLQLREIRDVATLMPLMVGQVG